MKRRLFIAIDFPSKVKKQIGRVTEELKEKYPQIRWEKKENLHLTLKFLGWVEEKFKMQNAGCRMTRSASSGQANQNSKIEEITEGMKMAVDGIKPFGLQSTKIDYFLKDSLIVWLGIESQEGLFKLAANLEEEMAKIGFPKEKRPFAAHATLGRKRQAHPISEWHSTARNLQDFKMPFFEKFEVREITLMESRLMPSGAIYTPLITRDLIF